MKRTILIVEDDPAMRRALVDTFRRARFSVLAAERGETGLKLALEQRPDIILLDLVLPGMSGLRMLDTLRKDAWGKTVSVVILTNATDFEIRREAFREGSYAFLTKSNVSLAEIVGHVQALLGKT